MTTQTYEETEWASTHFQREKQSGVFLGLGKSQVWALAIGLVIVLGIWFMAPATFPVRVLIALIVAAGVLAVVIPRPAGRPLVEWVLLAGVYTARGAWGFLQFRRQWHEEPVPGTGVPIDDAGDDEEEDTSEEPDRAVVTEKGAVKPGKPQRLFLAGEFDELLLYTMPDGQAMVWDPRKREAVIVAKIRTDKAFELESLEHQEDRTRAFSEMLTGLGRLRGVSLVTMSDQTTMISGANTKAWYLRRQQMEGMRTGADVDPFLHEAFMSAMSQEQGMAHHEMWMTIVLSERELRNRVKQSHGGIGGMMRVSAEMMRTIENLVAPTGAQVDSWHTPRSLSAVIRSAFDPESSVAISERSGEFRGVAPHAAGPMSLDVHRSHLSSDSGLHRTFMISEWPQHGTRFGFLDKLIFVGDFRHTVTIIQKPRDQQKALRQTRGRKSTWESSDRTRRRIGMAASLEHERELSDIELEEAELVNGHRALTQVGLVTVTGRDAEELDANCAELFAQAPNSNCEVRPLWWQQDSGFIASALPLGRIVVK